MKGSVNCILGPQGQFQDLEVNQHTDTHGNRTSRHTHTVLSRRSTDKTQHWAP